METMKNKIKVHDLFPIQVQSGDGQSSGVDFRQGPGYEAALIMLAVGNFTGTPSSVTAVIEESDTSDFSSGVTTMAGGAVTTLTADTAYTFEVKRTKRYGRIRFDFTGGTTPTAELHAVAILNNWALPFNR